MIFEVTSRNWDFVILHRQAIITGLIATAAWCSTLAYFTDWDGDEMDLSHMAVIFPIIWWLSWPILGLVAALYDIVGWLLA